MSDWIDIVNIRQLTLLKYLISTVKAQCCRGGSVNSIVNFIRPADLNVVPRSVKTLFYYFSPH